MEEKKSQIVDIANQILRKQQKENPLVRTLEFLAGDGSQRTFYRLKLSNDITAVAAMPNQDSPFGLREAESAWQICRHLYQSEIAVPEPLGYDETSGLILFEDLGDMRLHNLLGQSEFSHEDRRYTIYREVVRELIRMQVDGRDGFDTSWCWQTPRYDRQLMLEKESGYFLQALCQDYFDLEPDVESLNQEFLQIANRAAQAPADYFLHRDFQSRNIMVEGGEVRIIDFQGGRLGPLGYDLASLLIDPYVGLSSEFQETLFDEYLAELVKKVKYDPLIFREQYIYLAMQRNLQILGAFAFLGKQREKPFFLDFIQPALVSMQELLKKADSNLYPVLFNLIETCLERAETNNNTKATE